MSESSSLFLREEIENLLNKWAVERVQNPGTPGFYSRIFLVPKKNGKLRLIIDLSLLNRYIKKQSFKMETVKSVRQAMRLDWAVSIDVTDAYLHIPIHHQSRKYLRFVHEDQVYHFTALSFRMSLRPLIFSKLMDVADFVSRSRRTSTQKVYDAKWSIFSNWCHTKKVNPISAPVTVIANFLIFLFMEKKCQISIIKGYRAMISNTLKFKTGN